MKLIDKILNKIGLVRKSKHEFIQNSWKDYTNKLGYAAKEKGVNVIFDDTCLEGIIIDTDLFVLGSGNYISECEFRGCSLTVSGLTTDNYLANNKFIG